MSNCTDHTATHTFVVDALNVQVSADADRLIKTAAQQIVVCLEQILQQQSLATVVFATGRSQLGLLSYLRRNTTVDWSRVIGFHLDEFLGLSREHPASFSYYLHRHIAQWLPFQVFNYINGDALEPITECDRYTHLLTQHPVDVCLLGVGNNGHLAFNDPAVANFDDPHWVKIVRLDDINRQQQLASEHFSQLNDVPTHAITLSLRTIRSARHNFCCIFGEHKAKILKTLLVERPSEACPASLLRLDSQGENTLFVDATAFQLF